MIVWNFSCGCRGLGSGHFTKASYPGSLTVKCLNEQDGQRKARALGWIFTPDEYPIIACSQECWDRFHHEWEVRHGPSRDELER